MAKSSKNESLFPFFCKPQGLVLVHFCYNKSCWKRTYVHKFFRRVFTQLFLPPTSRVSCSQFSFLSKHTTRKFDVLSSRTHFSQFKNVLTLFSSAQNAPGVRSHSLALFFPLDSANISFSKVKRERLCASLIESTKLELLHNWWSFAVTWKTRQISNFEKKRHLKKKKKKRNLELWKIYDRYGLSFLIGLTWRKWLQKIKDYFLS